ncbi:unnamed protein product [Callosobruchus maculatus]|uniref:Uncharacterized protein n=1 Tax=Callosobruchus maculatus TaxID=64391 RepID=A0A653DEL0_CALMS|nr:unnamed protein product [Callosobruchus maculatus]
MQIINGKPKTTCELQYDARSQFEAKDALLQSKMYLQYDANYQCEATDALPGEYDSKLKVTPIQNKYYTIILNYRVSGTELEQSTLNIMTSQLSTLRLVQGAAQMDPVSHYTFYLRYRSAAARCKCKIFMAKDALPVRWVLDSMYNFYSNLFSLNINKNYLTTAAWCKLPVETQRSPTRQYGAYWVGYITSDPAFLTKYHQVHLSNCRVVQIISGNPKETYEASNSRKFKVTRHKRKVQNFLPCKNSPQNNCDVSTAAAIYEDLHDVLPRPTPTHHHHHHHHAQLAGRHVVAPSIEVGSVEPPGANGQHMANNQQTSTANRRVIPSITHRLQCMGQAPSAVGPYESVPVIGHHLATFRPLSNHNHKPYSHDSAIGSDSGYSNHTAGTR